jgi:hypothetical protein
LLQGRRISTYVPAELVVPDDAVSHIFESDPAVVDCARAVPLEPMDTFDSPVSDETYMDDIPKVLLASNRVQTSCTIKTILHTLSLDWQTLQDRSWYDIREKCIRAKLGFYETFLLRDFYFSYQRVICSNECFDFAVPNELVVETTDSGGSADSFRSFTDFDDSDKITVLEFKISN